MIIIQTKSFKFEDLKEIPQENLQHADAVDYAYWLVSNNNYGNRNTFNGDKSKQFYGILAEVLISDLLHNPRPIIHSGYDGGIDLVVNNNNIDIKNIVRNSSPLASYKYTNNLIERQALQGATDYYMLTSFDKRECKLYVMGYFSKDWLCYCEYYRQGQTVHNEHGKAITFQMDCYNISNYLLLDVFTAEDLLRVLPDKEIADKTIIDIQALERNEVYKNCSSNFLQQIFTMRIQNSQLYRIA